MDKTINEQLAIDALQAAIWSAFMQAYGRERPQEGLIVHTDQGSQFTSGNF